MAAGRQPQCALVHQGPTVSDADGRGDPEDKIAEADAQDAAIEPSILNEAVVGHPGARPQEDDLLRMYHHKNINSSPRFGLVVTLLLTLPLLLPLLLLLALISTLAVQVDRLVY